MKYSDIRTGMLVQDTWFDRWGYGTVTKKLKTAIHINFTQKGKVIFDIPHLIFLKKV